MVAQGACSLATHTPPPSPPTPVVGHFIMNLFLWPGSWRAALVISCGLLRQRHLAAVAGVTNDIARHFSGPKANEATARSLPMAQTTNQPTNPPPLTRCLRLSGFMDACKFHWKISLSPLLFLVLLALSALARQFAWFVFCFLTSLYCFAVPPSFLESRVHTQCGKLKLPRQPLILHTEIGV